MFHLLNQHAHFLVCHTGQVNKHQHRVSVRQVNPFNILSKALVRPLVLQETLRDHEHNPLGLGQDSLLFFAQAVTARRLLHAIAIAEPQLVDFKAAVVLRQLCHELLIEPLLFALAVADRDVVDFACICSVVVGPEAGTECARERIKAAYLATTANTAHEEED